MKDGSSHKDMVSPMTSPLIKEQRIARTIDRREKTFPCGLITGLKKICVDKARAIFPNNMKGMITGTACMTGEAAMKNAVTGVIIAKMIP